MKTNLSSQITLTRIPLKYYRPENAFEHSVLTRLEKIPTHIYESAEEGSQAIAREIATQIRRKQAIGKPFVLALPGGRSPLSVYKELIRLHKEEQLSFQGVIIFVEFEFYPLANPASGNLARLKEELLDHIDKDMNLRYYIAYKEISIMKKIPVKIDSLDNVFKNILNDNKKESLVKQRKIIL